MTVADFAARRAGSAWNWSGWVATASIRPRRWTSGGVPAPPPRRGGPGGAPAPGAGAPGPAGRSRSSAAATKGAISAEVVKSVGHTQLIGQALFTDFLLPFEITSILLLVAIIGAVVLAKKDV